MGQEAFEAHVRTYGPKIMGYLTRVLGNEDDAADAYSLWAEDVWRGLDELREPAAAKVWTYRIAWNAAARTRRQAWNRRRQRLPTTMASRLAAEALSRTPGAVEREAAHLAQLRQGLTPAEKSLLVLHVDRGLSWKEVAEVMAGEGEEVEEAALRQRFVRLRKKLAERARELGLLDESEPGGGGKDDKAKDGKGEKNGEGGDGDGE